MKKALYLIFLIAAAVVIGGIIEAIRLAVIGDVLRATCRYGALAHVIIIYGNRGHGDVGARNGPTRSLCPGKVARTRDGQGVIACIGLLVARYGISDREAVDRDRTYVPCLLICIILQRLIRKRDRRARDILLPHRDRVDFPIPVARAERRLVRGAPVVVVVYRERHHGSAHGSDGCAVGE